MTTVQVRFVSRRQNTNDGDDQYRLWLERAEAQKIAQHIPALAAALTSNTTWSRPVDVRWSNGSIPKTMVFGAYADQAGEMSFTASRESLLFNFAAQRHANGTGQNPIDATVTITNGTVVTIDLDLTL